jgi:hypothetical protein
MSDTITRQCGRCNGAGSLQAFAHVAGGLCVACGGKGTVERFTPAGRAASEARATSFAQLYAAAAAADAELRPSRRHHVADLTAREAAGEL